MKNHKSNNKTLIDVFYDEKKLVNKQIFSRIINFGFLAIYDYFNRVIY
jgi:hypothetical protein